MLPVYPLRDEEVDIPLEQNDLGHVRSSVDYRYGEIQRKGYSVTFRRLEEAHGSLTGDPADNGSLLIFKINPKTDSPKRRFKHFSVTLSLVQGVSGNTNTEAPCLVAFEPAADGDQFFQEKVTSITDTMGFGAGVGLTPFPAIEGNLTGNITREKNYEQRNLLKLSAHSWGIYSGIDTQVSFELEPASEENGIGDRFAVGVIVKRSPGTSFYVDVSITADVNFRATDALTWQPGQRQSSARFGPYGPASTGVQTQPPGVDIAHLQAASNDVLKTLTYFHQPEKGLAKLFQNTEAHSICDDTMNSNAHPEQIADTPANNSTCCVSETNALGTSPAAAYGEWDPRHINTATESANSLLPPIMAAVSPPQVAEVKMAGPLQDHMLNQHKGAQPSDRSLFVIHNSRAARHRLMASLYQNLAQLHLEEADEVEKLLEAVHTNQDLTRVIQF